MKHHRIAVIISLLITGIVLFAPPPPHLQAQTSDASISSLEFSYNDFGHSDDWAMRWDLISNTSSAQLQVTGGGITQAWTTVNIRSFTLNVKDPLGYTNKTKITFESLDSYRVGGQEFKFRVRVKLQDGSTTAWAHKSA